MVEDPDASAATTETPPLLFYESPLASPPPVKLDAINGVIVATMVWGVLGMTTLYILASVHRGGWWTPLEKTIFWILPAISVCAFIFNLKRRRLHPFITGFIDATMAIGMLVGLGALMTLRPR